MYGSLGGDDVPLQCPPSRWRLDRRRIPDSSPPGGLSRARPPVLVSGMAWEAFLQAYPEWLLYANPLKSSWRKIAPVG